MSARLRLLALLMLGLLAHALLVGAAHHHDGVAAAQPSAPTVGPDDCRPEQHAPGTARHTHCVSCQLQWEFASADRHPPVTLALPPAATRDETRAAERVTNAARRVLSDRAPPRA